ncbi:hypothetical protein ES703_123697 [subsurface metagenome]
MAYRLTLHRETLGVTQRALKALRDELARRIEHEILVFQVPSPDGDHCEVYGFFLVDKTAAEVAIIGDGFRGDSGGEGGSGHRAAQALLAIYGLTPIEMLPEDAIVYRDDPSAYRQAVDRALTIAGELHFDVAWLKNPRYVDWCFSHRR